MKKSFKAYLALLLALIMAVPAFTFSVSAAGQVYTIGGVQHVFLGAGETVSADVDGDGTNETYNTYSTLTEAVAAIASSGGVIGIVGEFTDPTTNGDKTFSDVSGRKAITIKGIGEGAALKFNHQLDFKGDVTFENFNLWCLGTKYVFGGGNTTFGSGMKKTGGIYYGNTNGTSSDKVVTRFNSSSLNLGQIIMSSGYVAVGSNAAHGNYEYIFDNYNCTTNIYLGFNNAKNTIYGNVNCIINGGTFNTKNILLHNAKCEGSTVTGAATVIFNNGKAEGFTVADNIDFVIESGVNGTASIKTPATTTTAPVFKFVPKEGYIPTINGDALLANADGEYLLSPSVSDTKQTFEIVYAAAGGEEASAIFYSIDGVKTGFVKANGGTAEYNGMSVVAFDTIQNALKANTDKADVTLVIIGASTREGLSYASIYPKGLLTIKGADEEAVLKLGANAHPWGAVKIENIALDISGAFCPDGNLIIIGEGVTGTMPKPLWGGGSNSPHGGNIEIHSGTWEQLNAGSNAATSATSEKTQSHVIKIYGGDFTNAKIEMGSSVATTVPKNMILMVNGGTFATEQQIYATNISSVGGVAAAIFNNGIADTITFKLPSQFKYVVKSGKNGSVAFDGEKFVITPDSGYAAVVNGKLSMENTIVPSGVAEYNITYMKASGTAKTYTVDGVKTAYVKKDGGLFKIDDDGTAYYAYSDILEAVKAAVGGRVVVIGEYTGSLRTYWGGEGVTYVSGYDENAVLTLSELYMWTPLIFENIKISSNSGVLNADSRKIIMGDGIEVVGNGLQLYGSTSAATRNTDMTIKSGKYSKVVGGNIGSTNGLSITLNIEGGDFSGGSVNLGNENKNTLNGNALLTISGGTFADGQEIKYSSLTTNGGAVAVITNDVDKTYNLKFADTFDAVVKLRKGGTYEISSYGSASEKPTFVFTPENPLYAPIVNGTMVKANASGKYYYTPEAADTASVLEVTWAIDTTPKAYVIDDVLTAFLSSESTVVIDDAEYYAFKTLTEAVAALGGEEGKVIIASDIENTGGDGGVFVDTAGRKQITIEGLTGNEVLSLDGTFGFKGDVLLDKFTLFFPKSLWAKYVHGYENIVFGKDFKIDAQNGAYAFFVPAQRKEEIASDLNVTVFGGSFQRINTVGSFISVPADKSVTTEIDGAEVNLINFGFGELSSGFSKVEGAINLIISSDTVDSKAITMEDKSVDYMTDNGTYTIIFNGGITDYTIDDKTSAILDYVVYSENGGKVTVSENGTSTASPTFLLTPDEGYTPKIDGIFLEEKDGKYFYTPEFTDGKTTINVEWASAEEMQPTVYEIDGERITIVRSGGGVVYYDNEAKFAFVDINSAISALGADGGHIKVYGNVQYVDEGTLSTNIFADVAGRDKVTITGIDGTNPKITYYQNATIAGALEVDSLTMHRLADTLYDTGFVTKGFELVLGKSLVTTTDFSQNLTIHGVSGQNITLTSPQIITIKGGTVTRVLPGTTWAASTFNGDSVINIEGGAIENVFGGSHGGQSNKSIVNGDVEINISGGNIGTVYTGGNSKSVLNGNVTVNITGGNFNSSVIRHGNATDIADNILNGNSVYVISDGILTDAKLGDGLSRGVTGEEIFIINNSLSGYVVNCSDKGTVIYYDPDGTVRPAYGEDGEFLGYEILCDIEGIDIVIDGEKVQKTADNIYTVSRGEHTVLFSTLWEVEFDLNGAEGTVPEKVYDYNDNVIALTAPSATMKNHFFNGWSTDKNAEIGYFEYKLPNDKSTLYAIWTEIKPETLENSNIENSDADEIQITSIPEDSYDSHSSIESAENSAMADSAIYGEFEVCYAFSLRAVDEAGEAVSSFPNGLNIRIPKYVLPERQVGDFYRIYSVAAEGEVSLMSEGAEITEYTEDDDYLYITAFSSGDYTVVLATAVYGEYLYKGEYDSAAGKYTLVLSFKGAEASFGSFGLGYDAEGLTLDSFTMSDYVTDMGSVSVADGGFGTYYNQNGIYQSTWMAADGVSVNATEEAVEIGTFVFTVTDGFKVLGDTFAAVKPEDSGIELDNDTLETVYSDGYYLYAPMVASIDVYCQPIKTEFDTGNAKYMLDVSYILERDFENDFVLDEESGVNNAAIITIANSLGTVYSTTEDSVEIKMSEQGKAVLYVEALLLEGSYTVTFRKNGYITSVTECTVSGADCTLGEIIPVCGDIKSSYDDICGDGIVDIDDFVRVLRGFEPGISAKLRQTVDVDESGSVNVTDLAVIKRALSR